MGSKKERVGDHVTALEPTSAPVAPVAKSFRNRIVGLRQIKAADLKPNKKNWRLHPDGQKSALQSILQDIGFVGALVAREIDGKFELLDGHLRADVAADREVPVLVVDLTDDEAAKVLATYDPLSSMAIPDGVMLGSLIDEIDLNDNAELRRLLTDLHEDLIEEKAKDKAEGIEPREIPGMALAPHEHYDYLVVLATTTQEWNVLCERLKLVPSQRRKSMGTCRAIRASVLLAALDRPKVPAGA